MSFTICGLCGDPASINEDGVVICKTCKPKRCKDGVKCTKCVKEDYPKKEVK